VIKGLRRLEQPENLTGKAKKESGLASALLGKECGSDALTMSFNATPWVIRCFRRDRGSSRQFSERIGWSGQRDEGGLLDGRSKHVECTGSVSKNDHWRGFLDDRVQQEVRRRTAIRPPEHLHADYQPSLWPGLKAIQKAERRKRRLHPYAHWRPANPATSR